MSNLTDELKKDLGDISDFLFLFFSIVYIVSVIIFTVFNVAMIINPNFYIRDIKFVESVAIPIFLFFIYVFHRE
ncbi:MAG: hypothetical protein LBB59_01045 [Campylobacteraceae bacterium]|jgi:hypothetical protein|nr:hypothetical protein [Campylobacteraceae bacterium]